MRRAYELDDRVVTLRSAIGVEGLTVLPPEGVAGAVGEGGHTLEVRELRLEGRPQRAVVIDLPPGTPVETALRRS